MFLTTVNIIEKIRGRYQRSGERSSASEQWLEEEK